MARKVESRARAIQGARSFDACWELDHDPAAIFARLQAERAQAVAKLLPVVESQPGPKGQAGGFLFMGWRYLWWGNTYQTEEAALKARELILSSLRNGTVDDPHDEKGVKQAAWRALGL